MWRTAWRLRPLWVTKLDAKILNAVHCLLFSVWDTDNSQGRFEVGRNKFLTPEQKISDGVPLFYNSRSRFSLIQHARIAFTFTRVYACSLGLVSRNFRAPEIIPEIFFGSCLHLPWTKYAVPFPGLAQLVISASSSATTSKMWSKRVLNPFFHLPMLSGYHEVRQPLIGDTDNGDLGKHQDGQYAGSLPPSDCVIGKQQSPWWVSHRRSLCEAFIFAAGACLVWFLARTTPMNLHDERDPSDGLTFTAGQLSLSQHLQRRPCGHTPDEAVARGCEFDLVTAAWLPPRCIDYELQHEFLTSVKPEGWHFWTDEDQVHEHDPDRIGFVTDEIWATNEWHMWHCLYIWRKLARAVNHGWPIDGSILNLIHMDHCSYSTGAVFPTTLNEVRSIVPVIYPPC